MLYKKSMTNLLTVLACSSTLWGDPTNSRNSVGATGSSRWENLLAASTESSSRNSILATGMPAWSTSTVVSTAALTVGKEHTAATVYKREREREWVCVRVHCVCMYMWRPIPNILGYWRPRTHQLSDILWADWSSKHLLLLVLHIAWQLSEWWIQEFLQIQQIH